MGLDLQECVKEKLWPILVDTVHTIVMYRNHKAYTRDKILQDKPDTTPAELAARLGMSLGEAMVMLHELTNEKNAKP